MLERPGIRPLAAAPGLGRSSQFPWPHSCSRSPARLLARARPRRSAAEANVRAAFAGGALQDADWLPGNTDIGRHQYNDCLILYMAINQQAPAERLLVSPIKPLQQGSESICQALRCYADGDKAAGRTGISYHQYIHGHTMLARHLLPHLGIGAIR